MIPLKRRMDTLTVANLVLLAFLLFAIFFVMMLPPQAQRIIYQICISGIILSAFFCIDKKYRRYMRWVVAVAVILQWTYIVTGNFVLNSITKSVTICIYIVIAAWLVNQVASSKSVNRTVIIEAVNGYLMIAMFFTVIVALINLIDPAAYHFQTPLKTDSEILTNFNAYLYYAFNAFTTVTYGDVIPVSPIAKSVSMAMGFTGQMYVAIIIAMLVGKYAGDNRKE